jgi:hypothetical protein
MGMNMPHGQSVAITQNQSSTLESLNRRRDGSSTWTAMQIVIESAALYSVAGLIYIPFVASFSGVPQNSIFLGEVYAQTGFTIAVVGLFYIFLESSMSAFRFVHSRYFSLAFPGGGASSYNVTCIASTQWQWKTTIYGAEGWCKIDASI